MILFEIEKKHFNSSAIMNNSFSFRFLRPWVNVILRNKQFWILTYHCHFLLLYTCWTADQIISKSSFKQDNIPFFISKLSLYFAIQIYFRFEQMSKNGIANSFFMRSDMQKVYFHFITFWFAPAVCFAKK